ncbi:MAG TPA: tetratricopeptide repeat protein [Bacteroidales bacterium]|nr:tetratricopeptide repeat protein [Bacteroidales bacterium]
MQTTKLIEEYLEHSLTPGECEEVERMASTDSSFKDLIELHKEVNEAIADRKLANFNGLVQKIGRQYTKDGRKTFFSSPVFRIAAASVFVVALAVVLKFTVFVAENDRIYKLYYTQYNADVATRSAQDIQTRLDQSVTQYAKGNFQEALTNLDQVIAAQPDNYVALFYKGLTLMAQNSMNEAVVSFRQIPAQWDNLLSEQRDWYLALALLKNDRLPEAETVFKQIEQNNGYYSGKAKEILTKLSD